MTLAIFGLGISGDDLVGLITAVVIAAYLVVALLKPEKL
jgi:K+-transporting ATPase KdpF subunit